MGAKGILFATRRVMEKLPTLNLLLFPLKACDLQDGPLPVINGVITPISVILTPVTHVFSAIYRGYNLTPFITIGSGPALGWLW